VTVARTIRRAVAAGAATMLAGSLALAGTSGGAAAAEEFIKGSGRADAKILRMGPSAGRLSLAPTIGLSLADYLGTLGRGESRTADFAALDGSVPEEMKAELPIVRAESTEEDAGTTHRGGFAGTPPESPIKVGGSEQTATASKDPKGSSSYTLGAYGLAPVFELGSSTASASAGVIGGKTREAIGTTKVSSVKLGGGAVTLNGLTWEAVQRTGEGATAKADFRVDSVTMLQSPGTSPLGLPLPPVPVTIPVPGGGTALDQVLPQINAALKPSGLILAMPSKSTDGGVSRVGPLGIQIADSEIGRTTLGPVLGALQPIRDPLTGALINADAEFSTAVLLADVAVGIFSGSGRNDIELGGASAFTEGESFVSPFGEFSFGSFTLPDSSDSAFNLDDSGSSLSSSPSLGGSSFGSTGGALGATGAAGTTGASVGSPTSGPGAQTAVPLAASRTIPGKRGGVAALIGLTGLLAALAVASLDYRRIRSNRRTIVVS
jgi:hypothetical protein